MIQRVYEQAKACPELQEVIVATDDQRIFDHVQEFGGNVEMTSPDHESGTDRCGEVLSKYNSEVDVVVNIQGDEPYIQPGQISELVNAFSNNEVDISTLAKKINQNDQVHDPNVVKVVKQKNSFALYFSRNPIPFLRNKKKESWIDNQDYFKHVGIYAYRTNVLKKLVQLEPSELEKAESLEQLRWLENGYSIHVGNTSYENIGIDTPDDLKKVNNN